MKKKVKCNAFVWKGIVKLWRIMRLTFLIILVGLLEVSASVYSQQTKLSLSMGNVTLEEVFRRIEDNSKYVFFYNAEQVQLDQKVNLNVENQKIEEILTNLLKDKGITFKVVDRRIVLYPISGNDPFYSQQIINVLGKATDSSGSPLPGVTVVLKGTTQGTITDGNGNYNISNVPDDATLVFSFVGMKTIEVAVDEKTVIDVVMEEDAIGIEEVVAVGYGTIRRQDFTGSVNSVDIENSPLSSLSSMNAMEVLRGSSAGLNVGAVNTAGGSPDLLIRGQNSINGSNEPLVVLDGIIFLGKIGDINPNDIASYNILKDASSAAAYGSRSANGVIIITTKKGKKGKPIISFNTSNGVSVWQQKPKLLDGEGYTKKVGAVYGLDDPLAWLKPNLIENYNNGKTTDWLDIVSRVGISQNYQGTVSGSNDRVSYYMSGGYSSQEGVIKGDDFNRISLRAKLDTKITDWLQVGVEGSYNISDYSGYNMPEAYHGFYNALVLSPYASPYRNNSSQLERYPMVESWKNPLWGSDGTVDDSEKRKSFRLSAFALVDIPFVKGLSYRLNYAGGNTYDNHDRFYFEGFYISEGYDDERYSMETINGNLSTANGYNNRKRIDDYVVDNILNYKKEFNEHYIDVTLVATRDFNSSKLIETTGSNYIQNGNTLLSYYGIHKAQIQKINMENFTKTNVGYLGRVSYSFNDKYHLNASIRKDGASVFGSDKKWGNFSSLGVAWTASKEDFFKEVKFVDYLKVKASYGKNGNQGIDTYETLSKVVNGSSSLAYEFSDAPGTLYYGLNISTLGNSLLGWETTTSFNGGFESVLMKNRISLDVDFYFSQTTDQLFTRNIPPMTGFSSIKASLGQVNNKGVDINLKTINIQQNNFKWTSNLSFWQNRNILAKLYGDDINGDGIEDDDLSNGLFIGKSLGAIYGYEYIGIVQEEDTKYMEITGSNPGDPKFADLNKDGDIDPDNDRKILGYTKENFRLSLANTFQYKNFDLYVLVSGIFGGGKNNYFLKRNEMAFLTSSDRPEDNGFDHIWWTPENRNNTYPSATYTNDGKFLGLQSRSFVRIQNISLSYNFRSAVLSKWNINDLKLYFAATNLLTFTDWQGGDPERGIQGNHNYEYPVPSSYTLGLKISF